MDERTWFVYIENSVALTSIEAETEEEAKERATELFIEWLQKGEIVWQIERE